MDNKLDISTITYLLGVPSKEIESRVNAKLDECGDKLLAANFPRMVRPQIKYNLKGHTAGQAIGTGIIRLNLDILNDPRYQDGMINDTVPHELAHCVVAFMWPLEPHHGLAWQKVMEVLGVKPTRCHNYETKAARKRTKQTFAYECHCKIHYVSITIHNRIQNGKTYRCKKCQGVLQ